MTRYNSFEQSTMEIVHKHGRIEGVYQGSNSVDAIQVIKNNDTSNKLFIDACSPYLTDYGNQKKTEFVLHLPQNGIDWRIECKSRKTPQLIGEILYDLNFVAELKERMYCLVLTDNLCYPYIATQIANTIKEKGIEDKVWFGTQKQFEKMLKKKLAA